MMKQFSHLLLWLGLSLSGVTYATNFTGCLEVFAPTIAGTYQLEVSTLVGASLKTLILQMPNSPPQKLNLQSQLNAQLPGQLTLAPNQKVALTALVDGRAVDTRVVTTPSLPFLFPGKLLCQLVALGSKDPSEFLVGKGDARHAPNITIVSGQPNDFDTATKTYYQQIDPSSTKDTLAKFITANAMGGANEIKVAYANTGDLGFGREMHCVNTPLFGPNPNRLKNPNPLKKQIGSAPTGSNIACYVSNFGTIDTLDSQDASLASAHLQGLNSNNPIATVAMEYNSFIGFVTFYVYDGSGSRITSADLDGFGARPVPQLCLTCHGGGKNLLAVGGANTAPNFVGQANLGANFLPFDARFYKLLNPAADLLNIKKLNQQIVLATNPNLATKELISGLYANASLLPHEQDRDFVAAGWKGIASDELLYKNVIAPACRSCHVAHDSTADGIPSFDTAVDFKARLPQVEQRVFCGRDMPHAQATYDLFWASSSAGRPVTGDPDTVATNMPGLLKLYGRAATGDDAWGDCVPPPCQICGLPVSFATDIQPILDVHCTSCHNATTPPKGLNLLSPNARQNLLNAGLVSSGNSSNSTVYHRVNDGLPNSPMPQSGLMLKPLRDKIRDWIDQGAKP
jgi:hypothetical protein